MFLAIMIRMPHGRAKKARIRAIDLFCGAGGSSWGARNAGAEIVAGIDASPAAGEAFKKNFPDAVFVCDRIEEIDAAALHEKLGPIDLILASPECTNHSPAKGKSPRCEVSKQTALQVLRFAEAFKPRWVVIENVVNMRRWTRYPELIAGMESLGYHVEPMVLDASKFGVPQSRKRLFLLCDRKRKPAKPKEKSGRPKSAAGFVNMNGQYKWRPLFGAGRALDTRTRALRAMRAVGRDQPFLIVYYGSDGSGGWQPLGRPLRTVTTLDRFAVVKPTSDGHLMRMLQVPELKQAMGMPAKFVAGVGSRRDQIKAVGNGVCPPVMTAVVSTLRATK